MNEKSMVFRGILHGDGSLEVEGRPNLAPGDVEITIRPLGKLHEGASATQFLERRRAELECAGDPLRTKEEIDVEIEKLRSGWDANIDEAYRQIEEKKSRQTSHDGTSPNE